MRPNNTLMAAHSERRYRIQEVGLLTPSRQKVPELRAGQVGYVIAGLKTVKEAQVGDTLLDADDPAEALPGFAPAKPMVFASIFPVDTGDFEHLQAAVGQHGVCVCVYSNDGGVVVWVSGGQAAVNRPFCYHSTREQWVC